MADDGEEQPLFDGKFGYILIAIGSASFVVTMYHLIIICCRHASEEARRHGQPVSQTPVAEEGNLVSLQIPSHKFEKKRNHDCVTCPVCLGDFEEGEELRTMPSCKHSFHVICIDMWLISHQNCPVCRADATPSPVVGSSGDNVDHSIIIV